MNDPAEFLNIETDIGTDVRQFLADEFDLITFLLGEFGPTFFLEAPDA